MLHAAVPDAVPDEPVLVDHVTDVTPTLSLAEPLKEIEAAEVPTVVEEGELMVSVGGVVSLVGGFPGLVAGWRVTTND
jgi:hypothetical protein